MDERLEALKEIASIIDGFYEGQRIRKELIPVADQIQLIHRIALTQIREAKEEQK